MKIFGSTDILLPKSADMHRWAVIACDQFTSDNAYWQRVADTVGEEKSTLHMILPEAHRPCACYPCPVLPSRHADSGGRAHPCRGRRG